MRLTLRQLQIFVAVARTGSTTAAAQSIALSQSATSAALNELEGMLGGQLFDRAGKRLILNDRGRAMLPHARWLIDGAQGIENQFGLAADSMAARLQIAASTTIGNYSMPKLIATYCRAHPESQIQVQIGNTRQVAEAVANFDVDIGFIEGPCHESQLRAIPWIRDEMIIACSPGHELARGRESGIVPFASLRQANWLLRERGSGTREAVEQALLPYLHQLPATIQLGSAEAIKQAVAEGLGVTCLSRSAVQDMVTLGRLVILKTELPPLHRLFYLVHHERKFLSASLEGFMAHCLSAPHAARTGG
jgi:DNA-binding transcriptional LysR family regulator